MYLDELDRLQESAQRTLKLKQEHAEKGHDWVIDAHTITSTKLLELVALARLGWPIWKSAKLPTEPFAHDEAAKPGRAALSVEPWALTVKAVADG